MEQHNMSSTDQIYEYFVAATDSFALGTLGRSPVRWEEVWDHFGSALDKRTVIHAWLNSSALLNATRSGFRAIYSVNQDYYLPHLSVPWQAFYDADPLAGMDRGSAAAQLVLGGETCLWGETADASDAMQTMWPRAAAAAERQWSSAASSSQAPGVLQRLQAFRCLLLERGVAAAPLSNVLARGAPAGPGSCLLQ
jgi:hexosaminidase